MEIFKIKTLPHNNIYEVAIFKHKEENIYQIINLTKCYICPCLFYTYDEAKADIYKYQTEKKNIIMEVYNR